MRWLNVLPLALCLAACGEPESGPEPAAKTAPAPATLPAPEPVTLRTVPEPFHGVWAATQRDCEAPAETRLEIAADRLRFYESSGPVASVEAEGADEILVIVSLTGEGTESRRSFRYRLLDGGSRLFDVRNGLERIRCPTA